VPPATYWALVFAARRGGSTHTHYTRFYGHPLRTPHTTLSGGDRRRRARQNFGGRRRAAAAKTSRLKGDSVKRGSTAGGINNMCMDDLNMNNNNVIISIIMA